ncbi:PucR family transcriptional regulator [Nocardia terpenica]|uniref:PucR family transcriptional regulator n=1 Tax=Nocardia terpenica TaxID=455432 RepID=UPI00189491FB|nr:PucR family transcriptional regulator [Nocardia terpenica]MBF6066339.1 PucR family transcriptional regulator [Nocardia terpenica]MBF6108988.1 PucR family transcriptional regulator [Nocardia terpenica]MBF6116586.1 PucR family transcriptional regulator [Nocardia terpenica]MBF6121832.1 PucR family transcriptional regulator [Nocardia terpenica]MBF6155624.1 PucR family transcriptional regulator [Nocardia terpenica]
MLPTVAEVLAVPVVRAGEPEVVGGGEALARPVRWVHVSEVAEVADLLAGGELILTTGQPLARGAQRTVAYLESLAAAGVSGVVVELGSYVLELPAIVAATADRLGLPVVALHRITRFVEVTEAVHRVIVADQYAELEFAQSVHETFTALSVRRASLAEIVKTAANLLDSSVVLEDLAHRVLALTARHASPAALLEDWESTSRMLSEDWSVVPVGPHTQRWGRLILRSHRIPSTRARMVLERAAQTLTLHRMIEKDRFGLHRQAQTGLIDDMVGGRVSDEQEAVARAAALGLARRARYVPLSIHVAALAESDPVARQRRSAALLDAAGHAVGLTRATALGAADQQQVTLLLAVSRGGDLDARLREVCLAVAAEIRRVDGVHRVAIGVGAESESLLDTARELTHAAHVAEVALSLDSAAPRPFYRSGDVRLRGLLSLIRNEPGVQRFAETELSALLRHDIRHRGDLTRTLRQFLDLAGNKTELARRMNISRPTLYDRLARIERILGIRLDDGEVRTSLHTALLIRDLTKADES